MSFEVDWTNEKIRAHAQREPERLAFWRRYYPDDELSACRAVVENPPFFDRMWEEMFPLPEVHNDPAS